MRIAVVGATGLTGRHTMASVRRHGHEAVPIARAAGVDILTGTGLARALDGADAVIDASNAPARDADAARAFFGTGTANLLAAEAETGVAHHVVLSIVGVDRVEGNAHYAGKRVQGNAPAPRSIGASSSGSSLAGPSDASSSADGTVPASFHGKKGTVP